ncbi:MAG: DUF6596 domain-containing protein [Thermodesulfobacteriota bacterium]
MTVRNKSLCTTEINHLYDDKIDGTVQELFQRESGKIISMLLRYFGLRHLPLVERLTHEAFLIARDQASVYGSPKYLSVWVWNNAKTMGAKVLMREKNLKFKKYEIMVEKEGEWSAPSFFVIENADDDSLKLLFACTRPDIPEKHRELLILNLLCGLNIREMKKAYAFGETVLAEELRVARRTLADLEIPLEVLLGDELTDRVEAVSSALFSLFKRGFNSFIGEQSLRSVLCGNLVSLAELLVGSPPCDVPAAHALLAYMLFLASRLAALVGAKGEAPSLAEQDRSLWDRELIKAGLTHLHKSAGGSYVSRYHLEAGIEACHCVAKSYDVTDWKRIISLYDGYMAVNSSPLVALSRAAAVAKVYGPREGIGAINLIRNFRRIKSRPELHEILGGMYLALGDFETALASFETALGLSVAPWERQLIEQKIELCKEGIAYGRSYDLEKAF